MSGLNPAGSFAPANSAGISHNLYTLFNAAAQGMVLNNSSAKKVWALKFARAAAKLEEMQAP